MEPAHHSSYKLVGHASVIEDKWDKIATESAVLDRKGSPLAGRSDKDMEGSSSTIDDGVSVYEPSLLKKYADKIHHVAIDGRTIKEDA